MLVALKTWRVKPDNSSHCQGNDKLHLSLLELEASSGPWSSADAVQECVTRALAAPLSPHTKLLLSQRCLQFVEEYSNSVQRLILFPAVFFFFLKIHVFYFHSQWCSCLTACLYILLSVLSVYEEHQKLLKELGGTKREAENR